MDVTSTNFEQVLDEVQRLLPSCLFMSIDEEMTGVRVWLETEYSWFDTPRDRYTKMRRIASQYSVMQFGLCLFHRSETTSGAFVARAYNFYVIPITSEDEDGEQKEGSQAETRLITLEPSAIEFHIENKMDFNKWFYEGIPFLDRPLEAEARKKIQSLPQGSAARTTMEQRLTKDLGFRRLFQSMSQSRVPLVGHNCLLDLMFMVHSFAEPLPPTLPEFVELINDLFPVIYDTKVLAHSAALHAKRPVLAKLAGDSRSSALNSVFKLVTSEPYVTIEVPDCFSRYVCDGTVHEAGYDAFMTGVVFANMHYSSSSCSSWCISSALTPPADTVSGGSGDSSGSDSSRESSGSSGSSSSSGSGNSSSGSGSGSEAVIMHLPCPAIQELQGTFPLAKCMYNLVFAEDWQQQEVLVEGGLILVLRLPKGFTNSDLRGLFTNLDEKFECGEPSLRFGNPFFIVQVVFFSTMDSSSPKARPDVEWEKSFKKALRDASLEVLEWDKHVAKKRHTQSNHK